MTAPAVASLVERLLECEDAHDDDVRIEKQTKLCEDLCERLSKQTVEKPRSFSQTSPTEYNGEATTIRQAFGNNVSHAQLQALIRVLESLMTLRVEDRDVLPATEANEEQQEEEANEVAMNMNINAITVTRPALVSARLYGLLLSMPGAFGCNLIQMQSVGLLQALVRRWCVDCQARHVVRLSARDEPAPTKRTCARRSATSHEDTTAHPLLLSGLQLGLALSGIPAQKEFKSWSLEAKEALLDAVVAIHAAAAVFRRIYKDGALFHMADAVVQRTTASLSTCIATLHQAGMSWPDLHEPAIFLLRGLLPILSRRQALSNGETGKDAAHATALDLLERFIQSVVRELPRTDVAPSTSTPKTPARDSTSTNHTKTTPRTPPSSKKKKRARRSSFGNGAPTTPAIKTTTPRTAVTIRQDDSGSSEKLRPVLSAIVGFLQKIATLRELDRAVVRSHSVKTVQRCLPCLPIPERMYVLVFLIQICNSKVHLHRLIGAELVAVVLSEPWFYRDHPQSPPNEILLATPHEQTTEAKIQALINNGPSAMMEALQDRFMDRTPTVRARACQAFSELLRKQSEPDFSTAANKDFTTCLLQLNDIVRDDLKERARRDQKPSVRKTATTALVELLLFVQCNTSSSITTSEPDVNILSQLCQDKSLATRKEAAEGLTRLLEDYSVTQNGTFITSVLKKAWSQSVFPLVLDSEPGCANLAVQTFWRIIIHPMVHPDQVDQGRTNTAWDILAGVAAGEQAGVAQCESEALRVALQKLLLESDKNDGKLLATLLKSIRKTVLSTLEGDTVELFQVGMEARRCGVWCLFEALVDQAKDDTSKISKAISMKSIGTEFIVAAWSSLNEWSSSASTPMNRQDALWGCLCSCLRVMSGLASCLDARKAKSCSEDLEMQLKRFALPPDVIAPAIEALVATLVSSTTGDARDECARLIRRIYKQCEDNIRSYLADPGRFPDGLDLSVSRALFTVGSLSVVGFRPDEVEAGEANTATANGTDPLAGFHLPPSLQLLEYIQTMMAEDLPGSNIATPAAIRAHSFLAVGKFCLRDASLARKCLTVFSRELCQGSTPGVQSNALVILGDLLVRYTNIVDQYLPIMASCLQAGLSAVSADNVVFQSRQDQYSIVRRHAVLVLSSLLRKDYIKWRGLLFHRFLVAAVDDDEGVAELAELMLCGPLLSKHPKLFCNNFVESLFVLNRCTAHPIYTSASSIGDGGSGVFVEFQNIRLSGESGRAKRHIMYNLMLGNMSDEEKIFVTCRLTQIVLGGAVKGDGDLSRVCKNPGPTSTSDESFESAFNVLSDAFAILTSPAIRVGKKEEDEDIEDPDVQSTSRRVAAATGKLYFKISRKHLVEIVLPILCDLKTILQRNRSPLLKDLMAYLVSVYIYYKAEAKKLFANKPDLLQEIEYDVQQFKKKQSKRFRVSVAARAT